ncbi:MAG: hypothetical protein HYT15_00205 [Candidatus Magasanikbacteria bacterium]|nr:hypothetical protein [Candidatus Magasanikbacteria bacterium]
MKKLIVCVIISVLAGACADWDQRPLGDDQQSEPDGSVVETDAGVDTPPSACAPGQINRDPVVQIVSPSPNTTFVRPGASTVTVVVDAYDPDASDLKQVQVVFRMDGQQEKWFASSVRTGNRYRFDVQTAGLLVDGTWQIEAIAEGYNQCGNDSDGQDITGMPVEQRIPIILTTPQPGNNPPTGSLTSPTSGQTFTAPTTVHMAANASDNDGNVVRVEFRSNNTLVHTDLSAPYEFDQAGVTAGTYVIKATAFDDDGASGELGQATITVGNSPAPSIDSFTASPSSCTSSCNTTLAWTTSNFNGVCHGNWTTQDLPVDGSWSIVVSQTQEFVLTCGTATRSVTVTVSSNPAPSIGSFTATPSSCVGTCTTTLNWASSNTDSCTASNGWTGTKTSSGSQSVTVSQTTTFALTCTGPGGTTQPSSVTVTVASTTPMAFDVVCPVGTTVTKVKFYPLDGPGTLQEVNVSSSGGIWHSPVGAGSATMEWPNWWSYWQMGDAIFHANAPTSCYAVLSYYGDGRHSVPYHLTGGEGAWGWAWNDQSRLH